MFSTKDQVVAVVVSPFLTPGNHQVHIASGEVLTSKAGDKKMLQFILETPSPSEDFEGALVDKNNKAGDRYIGQIGRVQASIYIDKSSYNSGVPAKNPILNSLMYLADSLKLRAEFDELGSGCESIDELVARSVELFKGKDFYTLLYGQEEENTATGKIYVKLSWPKERYISTKPENLDKFDMANSYHFRKAKKSAAVSTFAPSAAAASGAAEDEFSL